MNRCVVRFASLLAAGIFLSHAHAAPQRYTLDPAHTYPSFEADHMGVSTWRGKFNESSGWVVLDRAAQSGELEVTIEVGSIDFGHTLMNNVARSAQLFDVERHPQARYRGQLRDFVEGVPTRVSGELTLHGVSQPLDLTIVRFACRPHPLLKRELCGADASAVFDRERFGLDLGKSFGFSMDVLLRIQVEGVAEP